jgi:hypothetical protein
LYAVTKEKKRKKKRKLRTEMFSTGFSLSKPLLKFKRQDKIVIDKNILSVPVPKNQAKVCLRAWS